MARSSTVAHALTLSAARAKRFLVTRHGLLPPRSLPAASSSVLEVVDRLGSLQFDPLETPGGRNHDLVLHARIAGYRREWCQEWLYGEPHERRLFEAYNKSLNILPVRDIAYHRITWERAEERYRERIWQPHREEIAHILERLNEGPLSTTDLDSSFSERVAWHWAPTAKGRALLEAMFEAGRVGLAKREGNRRTFARLEDLFPKEILEQRVSHLESLKHRLLTRHQGVGLLGASAASEIIYGTGTSSDRQRALASLVREKALLPVHVEGLKGPRYVLRDERELLLAPLRPLERDEQRVTLLAPLDPFVWDRRLLRDLFSFDYTWEVYTPEKKRKYGYYVLPMLYGDELVGRIEPRFDRKLGELEIRGIWLEEAFAKERDEPFDNALDEALEALRAFAGATRIRWTAQRPRRRGRQVSKGKNKA